MVIHSIQRPLLLGALALASASGALGAEPARQPLSLSAAMAQARQASPLALAARARTDAAGAQVRQGDALRWPRLTLSELWVGTDSPAEVFAWKLNQERFSFAEFTRENPNQPDFLVSGLTRLELAVPLWTGGEIRSRRAQARLGLEAAEHSQARSTDQAALAAARAYILLAQVREQVTLLEHSRETVAAHVELARAYVEQGMVVASELLRAEVELARLDDLLAEARGRERVAEAALSFALAEGLDRRWDLEPLAEIQDAATARLEIPAGGTRDDLEAARRQVAAAELEVAARKAALGPNVSLLARHDRVDDRPFGSHGSATSAMAVASWAFFDGGQRRAAVAAAQAEAQAAKLELEHAQEGARLEQQSALEQARSGLERNRTARKALVAAAETVRILEERFGAGVVKTLDLLDAVTARREAETRELASRAEADLALLELSVAAGLSPESALAWIDPQKARVQP